MKSKNAMHAKIDATSQDAHRLAKAIKQDSEAGQAIRELARLLGRELLRCERLQNKIDQAFAGQPFLSNESPTSPKNQRRFKRYFEMMNSITKLKINLIRELMRVHGVDPNNPHQMWELPLIAGGIGAAGESAGAPPRQTSDRQSIPWEPDPGQYPPEVVSLARQLHLLGHGVKRPFDANFAAKSNSGTKKKSDEARVH